MVDRVTIETLSDTLCVIYSFLVARDQGSLRQTCRSAVDRFDQTVAMGWLAAVGSSAVAAWHCRRPLADTDSSVITAEEWHWFPVSRSGVSREDCDFNCRIETLQINADVMAGSEALRVEWGFAERQEVTLWFFLSKMYGVRRVCFLPSTKLVQMAHGFLSECEHLVEVDFYGLGCVVAIDDYWLYQCPALEKIGFEGLENLSTVGDDWLAECSSIKEINFRGLAALSTVGHDWMQYCTSLKNPDFHGLTALTSIGVCWLRRCVSLEKISFDGLSSLAHVQNLWLDNCESLENINFSGLDALSSVGDHWISTCDSIETISFEGLSSLKTVGDYWLYSCANIKKVNFEGLDSLEVVGAIPLEGAASLQTVTGASSLPQSLQVAVSWCM